MSGCTAFRSWTPAVLAVLAGVLGCQSAAPIPEPQAGAVAGLVPTELENRATAIQRDPEAYLLQVLENCRRLEQYTLTFIRHERRGLLHRMFGPEHIEAAFRRDPFSVHLKWTDENIKYYESVYVAGGDRDVVRFITRWWSPPLLPPPRINVVDVMTPVRFGESQRPLTDFGLERLMERTLDTLVAAGDAVIVRYEGVVTLPDHGPVVHHIHIELPQSVKAVPIQELYIDVRTDLPAGTVLKTPSGKVDAAYFYRDLDVNVELTPFDFLLEPERAELEASATSQPAGAS